MLMTLLLIVLIVFLVGGVRFHPTYGYAGFSPLAIILIVIVVLALTGHL